MLKHKQFDEYGYKLQRFAQGYNKTVHRILAMRPFDARRDNEEEVRVAFYISQERNLKDLSKHKEKV